MVIAIQISQGCRWARFALWVALVSCCGLKVSAHTFGMAQEDTTAEYVKPLFGTTMPHFDGGEQALREFVNKNLIYPEAALKAKAEAKVYISFVVTKKGNIRDIRLKRHAAGEYAELFEDEALRIMRLMPPWVPGSKDKEAVNMRMEMPFSFHL